MGFTVLVVLRFSAAHFGPGGGYHLQPDRPDQLSECWHVWGHPWVPENLQPVSIYIKYFALVSRVTTYEFHLIVIGNMTYNAWYFRIYNEALICFRKMADMNDVPRKLLTFGCLWVQGIDANFSSNLIYAFYTLALIC